MKNVSWFWLALVATALSCRGEVVGQKDQRLAEPRVVKRRPKNFRLLTKPRCEMVVERCRKQSQKPSNNALN
jgi:hypothetical protein